MTAGLFARVPAIAALVTVALLATATLTLAATSTGTPPAATTAVPATPATLVVPDVRRQAYVFAKGTLEQSGFAWKVAGPVQGYAANLVVAQTPAPGTRVVADGMPIINLSLSQNPSYKQDGVPDNVSPFAGRPVRLPSRKPKPAATPARPAAKPVAKPAAKPKRTPVPAAAKPGRQPAFAVAGAPREPLDEISLSVRVQRLDAWLDSHRKPTPAAVNHWLYQHNWIVTGASFGWSGGAEALRALVAVDTRVQKLWGVGGRSKAVARRALAEVEAKSR
jgi:hypothetical protein